MAAMRGGIKNLLAHQRRGMEGGGSRKRRRRAWTSQNRGEQKVAATSRIIIIGGTQHLYIKHCARHGASISRSPSTLPSKRFAHSS